MADVIGMVGPGLGGVMPRSPQRKAGSKLGHQFFHGVGIVAEALTELPRQAGFMPLQCVSSCSKVEYHPSVALLVAVPVKRCCAGMAM
jgi:hypothetical protein